MTEMHHNLEASTCDPLKYNMGNSILILSTCMGKCVRLKSINDKASVLLSQPEEFTEKLLLLVGCIQCAILLDFRICPPLPTWEAADRF